MLALFIFKLIFWTLIAFGITQIIVESIIFQGIRNWVSRRSPKLGIMLSCMLCTGVWVSVLLSTVLWSPSQSVYKRELIDVAGVIEMENTINDKKTDISGIVAIAMYHVYSVWVFLKIRFFDAMLGCTLIWFLHVLEYRLSMRTSTNKKE